MGFPFKEYDGMRISNSTSEERSEIYELANKLKLVPAYCLGNLYKLKYSGFLFMGDGIWCNNVYADDEINHIPFEEFKQRLLDYEKSLTNK